LDPEGAGDRFRDTLQAHTEGLSSWGIGRLRIFREGESAPPEAQEALEGGGGCLLESLALEVASCTACRLSETRNLTVFGVGDPDADLMLVGEAPGHEEDLRGEPFVGAAGKLLDRILVALGLAREQVYIANVLKCRPPGNRNPNPDETGACRRYLEAQIDEVKPRMLVALGRPAANWLTGKDLPIGRLRGGRHQFRGIPVVVTYHPAYLLRKESAKKLCWQDLQEVIAALGLQPPSAAPSAGR